MRLVSNAISKAYVVLHVITMVIVIAKLIFCRVSFDN